MADFERRGLGDIGAELRAELDHVVRKNGGLMAGAGDRYVTKSGVEQVWVDAGVGIDEDALGGEALGTVAGDGVAVVEVVVLLGIEFDLALVVETGRNASVRRDGLDGSKVAVGNAEMA